MSKISIELLRDDSGSYVPSEMLTAITIGCLQTLERLGKIGEMIEVFKITFTSFPNGRKYDEAGPVFKVHFRDPLGTKCSHGPDFRFMGKKTPNPTAAEISEHLSSELPRFLKEPLERAKGKIEEATSSLTELSSV